MTVMIGIDPHKATHTAVAIDEDEHVLEEVTLRASRTQTPKLLSWADRFEQRCWAVESAQGLGYLLSQQLVAAGEQVFDVSPVLAARVRLLDTDRSQKNDPNDARSVAIAALRSDRVAQVRPDDHTRVLRLLVKRHRDLGRLHNKTSCRLHALLAELVPGGVGSQMTVTRANTVLDGVKVTDAITAHRVELCRELIDDIGRYHRQRKASKHRINTAVAASQTSLTEIFGVGPICAGAIIGYTGDIERFASRGHYASYNATAPIDAFSGDRPRQRLNPRGNRRLNWAIHMIAITQLRHPTSPGRAYFDRKIAEGKTSKEAIRALKRRLSDVVYRHLVADAKTSTSAS